MQDFEKYRQYFSESEFWNKVGKTAGRMGLKLTYYALVLFYAMLDPATPRKAKLIIIGALGYLILPLDLVPDFIPGGHLDDLGVITAAVWQVIKSITPDIKSKAARKVTEWFPSANASDLPDVSSEGEIDEQ